MCVWCLTRMMIIYKVFFSKMDENSSSRIWEQYKGAVLFQKVSFLFVAFICDFSCALVTSLNFDAPLFFFSLVLATSLSRRWSQMGCSVARGGSSGSFMSFLSRSAVSRTLVASRTFILQGTGLSTRIFDAEYDRTRAMASNALSRASHSSSGTLLGTSTRFISSSSWLPSLGVLFLKTKQQQR